MDAGCAQGAALIALAEHYPRSRFTGYDLKVEAVDRANTTASHGGLGNVRFEAHDLTGYDERDCFDLITSFDAIHDQKDPARLDGKDVHLADGQRLRPEVVIAATGSRPKLKALVGSLRALDTYGRPHYPMGEPDPDDPRLWFTGFTPTFTG